MANIDLMGSNGPETPIPLGYRIFAFPTKVWQKKLCSHHLGHFGLVGWAEETFHSSDLVVRVLGILLVFRESESSLLAPWAPSKQRCPTKVGGTQFAQALAS